MYRTVTEYKTYGDLLGAIKQALRRFTPNGACLIQIENINSENHVVEQNLVITDGNTAIRITEITESDLVKLKTLFNEIATPYVFVNNKWVSILKDPDYTPGIIDELTDLLTETESSSSEDNLF